MKNTAEFTGEMLMEGTPAGHLLLRSNEHGLTALIFLGNEKVPANLIPSQSQHMKDLLEKAASQLGEYFTGQRRIFDLPLDISILTPFTQGVLREASSIGYGQVVTYGELAHRIDKPQSARAVGSALAHNPIPIIIPCHRVVAADNGLHGYSAPGGIAVKERLLRLEGINVQNGRVR